MPGFGSRTAEAQHFSIGPCSREAKAQNYCGYTLRLFGSVEEVCSPLSVRASRSIQLILRTPVFNLVQLEEVLFL